MIIRFSTRAHPTDLYRLARDALWSDFQYRVATRCSFGCRSAGTVAGEQLCHQIIAGLRPVRVQVAGARLLLATAAAPHLSTLLSLSLGSASGRQADRSLLLPYDRR